MAAAAATMTGHNSPLVSGNLRQQFGQFAAQVGDRRDDDDRGNLLQIVVRRNDCWSSKSSRQIPVPVVVAATRTTTTTEKLLVVADRKSRNWSGNATFSFAATPTYEFGVAANGELFRKDTRTQKCSGAPEDRTLYTNGTIYKLLVCTEVEQLIFGNNLIWLIIVLRVC